MTRRPALTSRRSLLRSAGLVALVAAGAGCGSDQTGRQLRSAAPLPRPFTLPLRLPPVLAPVSRVGGADRYRVTARAAEQEILPGLRTPVLGYEGAWPGPTIESRRGRPTVMEHRNELPVPMVVHLHGGVVPAASDGFPTDLVLPASGAAPAAHVADPEAVITRGTREYRYPMDQAAATLWYHDHRMDLTGPMVYRGLAGFHLVRDDVEDGLPLPRGDRELPLMVADRAFGPDGELRYPARDVGMTGVPGVHGDAVAGVLGDVVLVNGVPWPVAEVDAARYRLRWLNGSNARRYRLRLDPPPPSGPTFVQIGSDGGLLPAPVALDTITMAAGERCDVVVDFGAYPVGTAVTVRNGLGSGPTAAVLRFVVARRAADGSRVPALLAPAEPLQLDAGAVTRTFRFRRGGTRHGRGWTINGRAFDPTAPVATVPAGRVERWRVGTDLHHPVHVHLGRFRVLARQGDPPEPHEGGLKDTVDVRPAEDVDLAVRFPRLPGRYLLHCHNLEHKDMAMMATIRVV